MSEREFRFIELTYRLSILREMRQKIKKELNDSAISLLGGILGKDEENIAIKKIGLEITVDTWIDEIVKELAVLSGEIYVEQVEDSYRKVKNELNKIQH